MKDRACIYVAGPLSAPTLVEGLNNIGLMLWTAHSIEVLGHAPFFPAWDVQLAFASPRMFTYEDFFESNAAWLRKADAIYVMEHSPGVDREIEIALKARILVLDKLEDIAHLARGKDGKWQVKTPTSPD